MFFRQSGMRDGAAALARRKKLSPPDSKRNRGIFLLQKYDPELFASGGCVDPISLAMTMEGQEDEKV